jgi:hypothetical protein
MNPFFDALIDHLIPQFVDDICRFMTDSFNREIV